MIPTNKIRTDLVSLKANKPFDIITMDFTLMDEASDGTRNGLVMTYMFGITVPTKPQL